MAGVTELHDARILVVDDLDADARLIAAMLEGSGYSCVVTATDPREAWALHRARRCDLVFVDVLMPHMDGFELLRALHAEDAEVPVPVIMTTAEPDHMKRALESGARDFIAKPVRLVELLARVRNALELGRLLRDSRSHGRMLERTLGERTAELEEAQERYRVLVEQSIAGIYEIEDHRFTYANPRLGEWLGYSPEELRGMETMAFVVEEDRERVRADRGRRASRELLGPVTYRLRRRDGRVVHLSFDERLVERDGKPVILGIAQDVSEREIAREASRRATEELREANQRLRTLSDRVLAVQEEERRRISRELHDDVGQSLVALDIGLHRLEPHLAAQQRGLLAECIDTASVVAEKLRVISTDLHPPHLDQLGLPDALRWLVNRQREVTGVAIEWMFQDVEDVDVAPGVEAACYRICQEALSNAARHSRARRITVELSVRHGRLVARISDDGVGFDQPQQRAGLIASGSMGLVSMEERARLAGGTLSVRSAPGAGTCVSALFPIDAHAAESAAGRERV